MTRDELKTALANKGIMFTRETKNGAFFQTPDGRKARLTSWTEPLSDNAAKDVEAQIAAEAVPAPSVQRKDIHRRYNVHLDRTAEQEHRKVVVQRRKERRERYKAIVAKA